MCGELKTSKALWIMRVKMDRQNIAHCAKDTLPISIVIIR